MYSLTERLTRIVNRNDLPEEVESELVSILEELEIMSANSVSELETTLSIGTRQMRFDYEY